MADKKQKRNNNKNYDEDYNPKFRKQRKKVCVLCSDFHRIRLSTEFYMYL